MSKRSNSVSRALAAFAIFMAFMLSGVASAQVSVTATVGTAGPTAYTTLKGAFDAVNVGTHRGTIVISITANSTESAPAALNASGSGASSYTAISIKPSGGAARLIFGNMPDGTPLIDLNGADNVTIDGLNTSGNTLALANLNGSAVAGTSTLRFINGASNNTVTNTTLHSVFSGAVTVAGGTVLFGTDSLTASGNDNNTIADNTFANLFGASSTTGIHMLGTTTTSAINNSGNVITGNNFEDIFGAAVSSSAVYIGAGNTDVTISNNKFYQTATRTQTTGTQHSAIWIQNTGNNFLVSGNTIGFASSAGTGVYSVVAAVGTEFIPIALTVGITTATSVQNNTIAGIAMSGASSGDAFRGIHIYSGATSIGNVTGNTIGSPTANGNISYTSSVNSTSTLYAISDNGTGDSDIRNNQIGGITAGNSNSDAVQIFAIAVLKSGTNSTTVQNNLIGGTVANSIQSTSSAVASRLIGSLIRSSRATVTGNTIKNLTASGGTGTSEYASVIGISILDASSVEDTSIHTVSQNSIFKLVNANATDSTVVTGIEYRGDYTGATGTNLVERNLIHSLSNASVSASAEINGISASGGATTYRNNMVAIGTGVGNAMGSGSNTGGVNGFKEFAGTNNFFHNSVYVGGTATTGSGPSSAFASTALAGSRSIRNNIFQNARSNSGTATGKNYVVRVGGSAANPPGLTINNNLYFANATGGVLGYFNSADVPNIAAWKTAVGNDAGSLVADPKYLNPTAATPDLHLQTGTLTAAEGNGGALGVPDDFDGQARASLTPHDIGADAGNFIGGDAVPPIISYALFGKGAVAATRVLAVTLTDVTAVATGSLAPRIYFSKNVGSYVSAPCTLVSGTVQNGAWNCAIDYAMLGGVLVGDVIKYFVVAQDTAAHLGGNPDVGFAGLDVNTVSSPPIAPNQYAIGLAFSGSYSTGPGESFTSLTRAGAGGLFAAINAGGLTGNVTINITGDLLIEDGAVALNQWSEEGLGNYTLLIKPSGAARTISGSSAGSLIRLNDADRVTIDGSLVGGTATGIGGNSALRQLTIANTNVGSLAVVLTLSGVVNGAQNNTFKNLNILGQNPLTTLAGIALGGATGGAPGFDNDNNRIENCSVQGVKFGIYSAGQSASNPNTGTMIHSNEISASGPNRVSRVAIAVFNEDGIQIIENSIGGIETNETADAIGIALGAIALDSTAVTGGGVINANVSRNKINGVTSNSVGGFSAAGIVVAGGVGANILANNMITSVTSNATYPDLVAGIFVAGAKGSSTKLFHNSVAMTGARIAKANQLPSYAAAITGTDPVVELNNNIFYSTQDGTLGGVNAKSYAIGTQTTTFSNLNSNFNTFYTAGPTRGYFRTGSIEAAAGTNYAEIAQWRTATGNDANSLDVDPLFVNPLNDLHLQATSPMLGQGTPIAGVTVDIDGQARDTPPDIGADEIPTPVSLTINVPAGIQFSRDATVFTGSQTFNLAQGTSFTLSTTSPQNVAAGSRDAFVSWSDAGAISHNVTVTAPTTITASFVKQHQLTVSAGADGSVTPTSGTFYNAGSVVPVTATANAGFGFVNWTGSVANPTAAATTVTMSAPQTITANFVALPVDFGPILNIDNSDATTKYHPATDGVLMLRYLLGLRGSALIANARGTGAGLRDAAAIEAHLAANLSLLDVDGDTQTLALTDGLMILRRLLNPTSLATDASASAAITAGAKRGVRSDEAVVRAIDALKP